MVALVVYVKDHRRKLAATADASTRVPQRPAGRQGRVAEPEAPAAQYDFYEMLPKFEVVVPEKDREVRRDQPSVKIERPGRVCAAGRLLP